MAVNKLAIANALASVTFISADNEMNVAASGEGLVIENPILTALFSLMRYIHLASNPYSQRLSPLQGVLHSTEKGCISKVALLEQLL